MLAFQNLARQTRLSFQATSLALVILAGAVMPALAEADKDRLVVMPFGGPKTTAIDADILWKAKTGMTDPTKAELSSIPRNLSDILNEKLAEKLGKSVVSSKELKQTLDDLGLSAAADKSTRQAELVKRLGVGYTLEGDVDRLEFDGNTVLSDKYVLIVSARLVKDGSTSPVWKTSAKRFYKKVKAAKGRALSNVFIEEQLPEIAESLADEIAKALGR